MVDPHFDEGEFLTGAIGAHEVVLKNFAANDMRALGAMLTDRALAAFRDAFIEADRRQRHFELSTWNETREPHHRGAVDTDKRRRAGRAGGGGDGARARQHQLVRRRRRDGGFHGAGGGGDDDGSDSARFDAGEDDLLRLRVGVRFNSRELWTMTDKVSGRKSYSMDLRGHTFYFGRALPRFLPATAPLTSPWLLEDVRQTSRETRRAYEEIVLSNYEQLVYSPAGCTPRLSSILLVFLAPIFFLGLGGNIFCAYWYLVVKREFGRDIRPCVIVHSTRSGSGYATAARVIGEKNVAGKYSRDNVTDEEDAATIATTMPMITKGGVGLVVCHHPPMLIDERKVRRELIRDGRDGTTAADSLCGRR